MITTLSRIANCCVPARNTAETVGVQMTECDKTWWMLSDIVDWVRRIDPTATVGRIRVALADACASNRIRARGHQRVYLHDRRMPIAHWDPTFVQFADEYGELRSSFDAISAAEWKDLTFFQSDGCVSGWLQFT